jgi:hypothetical protein
MMSKMAKTPHSAFLSPATNRGSLSNVLTPGTEKTLTVDGTAALPTIDCFGSMQGLIVPAKERPRGSPDDEEALAPSSDVEDRVNGFLLVKEEKTTGDDRGLQAQLTEQSSYISTLEEDNQRLREVSHLYLRLLCLSARGGCTLPWFLESLFLSTARWTDHLLVMTAWYMFFCRESKGLKQS